MKWTKVIESNQSGSSTKIGIRRGQEFLGSTHDDNKVNSEIFGMSLSDKEQYLWSVLTTLISDREAVDVVIAARFNLWAEVEPDQHVPGNVVSLRQPVSLPALYRSGDGLGRVVVLGFADEANAVCVCVPIDAIYLRNNGQLIRYQSELVLIPMHQLSDCF
ncbi:hypothetical protein [uncultured Umboniibacter sp.]|uniref:hypothetical protein n=1 Tax=uncultured Umboniibacter sp. TaxID=1798917 RepID=UPI0026089685|nr:hypothetical protein [uncultured Umboniibacter sp.]